MLKLGKGFKYAIATAVVALALGGCGQPEKPKTYVDPEFEGAPEWVMIPYVKGKVAEMGSAPRNKAGNFSFQRELATANARTALARKLETKVKSMFKTYSSQTSANGGTFDQTAESVSKQLTNQSLKNVTQHGAWTSKSGTLYVLVAIPKEDVTANLEEGAKSAYKNDNAAYQKFMSAKAQGELDKALE